MTFKVKNIKEGIIHEVYAISENLPTGFRGDIYFMMWDYENDKWIWSNAKFYEPWEE